jgi:hypothetical protein
MTCLPDDPGIYVDEQDIRALAADLCERLRASPGLRPLLNLSVGNRWLEFEQGLAALMARDLFDGAPMVPELDWLLLPEVSPAVLAEGLDHLLGACLLQFPLHVGAGLVERADNWVVALDAVVGVPGPERPKALAALRNRIAAGAVGSSF